MQEVEEHEEREQDQSGVAAQVLALPPGLGERVGEEDQPDAGEERPDDATERAVLLEAAHQRFARTRCRAARRSLVPPTATSLSESVAGADAKGSRSLRRGRCRGGTAMPRLPRRRQPDEHVHDGGPSGASLR